MTACSAASAFRPRLCLDQTPAIGRAADLAVKSGMAVIGGGSWGGRAPEDTRLTADRDFPIPDDATAPRLLEAVAIVDAGDGGRHPRRAGRSASPSGPRPLRWRIPGRGSISPQKKRLDRSRHVMVFCARKARLLFEPYHTHSSTGSRLLKRLFGLCCSGSLSQSDKIPPEIHILPSVSGPIFRLPAHRHDISGLFGSAVGSSVPPGLAQPPWALHASRRQFRGNAAGTAAPSMSLPNPAWRRDVGHPAI